MAIVRQKRPEGNFYILDKTISEDRRLSWSARGVLIFLLGKPDHWKVSIQNLINETEEADPHSRRDAIYKILGELQRVGYVSKSQSKQGDGLFGETDYLVGETAQPLTDIPEAEPLTALPLTVEPLTVNPYLVSTDVLVSNKKAASIESRGTRLPTDWQPDESFIEFCRQERPDLSVANISEQFRDYWISQPGAKGRKADWLATWRNWVRTQRAHQTTRSFHDERADTIAALTGRNRYEPDERTIDETQFRLPMAR